MNYEDSLIVFGHVNIIVAEVTVKQGKMRFLLKTVYKPYKGIYSLQKCIFASPSVFEGWRYLWHYCAQNFPFHAVR